MCTNYAWFIQSRYVALWQHIVLGWCIIQVMPALFLSDGYIVVKDENDFILQYPLTSICVTKFYCGYLYGSVSVDQGHPGFIIILFLPMTSKIAKWILTSYHHVFDSFVHDGSVYLLVNGCTCDITHIQTKDYKVFKLAGRICSIAIFIIFALVTTDKQQLSCCSKSLR